VGSTFSSSGGKYPPIPHRHRAELIHHPCLAWPAASSRIFPKHASIMAKKELAWAPLLGGYLSASGAVFVDRRNNNSAVQSLKAAGDFMKEHTTSLWLFPEGTRSMRKHHDLLPFKKGAFHTAVQAGVPVTPVVCENYWRLYHKGRFEGGVLKIRGKFEIFRSSDTFFVFSFIPCSSFDVQSCHRLAQQI